MHTVDEILEIIKSGSAIGLEDILVETPSLVNENTEQGISVLQLAAYYRNNDVVAILRKYKTKLTIFEAASVGDEQLVSDFLGEDETLLNSFASDGFTPLGLASFFGQMAIVKLLLDKGANPNIIANNAFKVAPIHSACAISNVEIVTLLIEHGANVNAKQMKGITPLHSAAHNGQDELVQLLVDSGAEINAKMEDGKTPLAMAGEKGFSETVTLLKNLGG